MRPAAFLLGVVFMIGLALTPLSCQYVERNGPDWVRPLPQVTDNYGRSGKATSDGYEATFGLLGAIFAFGALRCVYYADTGDWFFS